MAVNPYATLDDLAAYLGEEPPAGAQRLLARAQELVDAETTHSLYAVDVNGNPTNAGVIAALKTATIAQVEDWLSSGDELNEMGQWQSITFEGTSLQRRSDDARRRERLCDRARDALRAPQTDTTPLLPGYVGTT